MSGVIVYAEARALQPFCPVTLDPGAPPPIQAHSAYCIVYSNPVTRIVTHLDGELSAKCTPPHMVKCGAYPLPNLLSFNSSLDHVHYPGQHTCPFSPIRSNADEATIAHNPGT